MVETRAATATTASHPSTAATYRMAEGADGRHLHRRLGAGLHRGDDRGRPRADLRPLHEGWRATCWPSASFRASPTRTTCRSSPAARRRCTASPATTSSIRRPSSEVMMNDPKFLRAPTVLRRFHDAGAKVAVVTAKDKLRAAASATGSTMRSGRAIAFSSEKADKATQEGQRHRQRAASSSASRCRTSIPPICRSSCSPPASS